MIHTILVVDDDFLISKWLGLLIEKSTVSNAQVFCAENGEKALDVLSKNKIDMVITDINMPDMNGIQLIKEVKAKFPNMPIAVLSAYDDYQYVRNALKDGILDYLLKSEIELNDIDALLVLAQKYISANQVEEQSLSEDKQIDYMLIAEKFQEYMADPIANNNFLQYAFFDNFQENHLYSMLIHVQYKNNALISHQKIIKHIESVCNFKNIDATIIPYQRGTFLFLFNSLSDDLDENIKRIDLFYDYLFATINKQYNLKDLHYVHSPISSINLLYSIVKTLENILKRKFFYEVSNISAKDVTSSIDKEEIYSVEYSTKIRKLLQAKKIPEAISEFHEYIELAKKYYFDAEIFKNRCNTIIYLFINSLQVIVSNIDPFLASETSANILKSHTITNLCHNINNFTSTIIQFLSNNRKYSPTIEKSLAYIDENSFDKISLEQISQHVFLNKNYFSELFKKEVGVNFNEYLNRIRIQKACDLLMCNRYSLSQIAQMVGFSDQNYFSKIFKKIVGIRPTSYRDSMFKNDN